MRQKGHQARFVDKELETDRSSSFECTTLALFGETWINHGVVSQGGRLAEYLPNTSRSVDRKVHDVDILVLFVSILLFIVIHVQLNRL
jgi:hypothetical protein